MSTPAFDIKQLMESSKNNRQSQKTKTNLNLLSQAGGSTPQEAATSLVEKHAQLHRYIDSILFG